MAREIRASAWFPAFARRLAHWAGRSGAFVLAIGLVAAWLITGPLFGFSDTWQLVINTGTTIVTFLMVFLIQNTQNRDTEAMQIKLDEIIRATRGAENALLDLENLDEEELETFRRKYYALALHARRNARKAEGNVDGAGAPRRAERRSA
jgi:low affinity Fe/Cu permease